MPIHPFLLAVYIVVSLYANNTAQVPVGQMVRPLIFFLLLAAFLVWLFSWRTKDKQYSAYAASWTLLWLALFGHLYQAVNLAFLATAGRAANETITLIVWTLVMGLLGTPMAWKSIRNKKLVNEVLTAIAVGAAIVPFITTAFSIHKNNQASKLVENWKTAQSEISIHTDEAAPDIYYIILDGYGRQDVLVEYFGFDNSDFLDELKERNFYVAEKSNSNYLQTALSLSSALNMEYVDFLGSMDGDSRSPAYDLLANSRIRAILEQAGYTTVNIAGPVLFTQFADFDIYLAPGNSFLTEFEKLLISLTPIATFARDSDLLLPGYESHRAYTLHSFDAIEQAVDLPGPKFVFIHIIAPHPPFVFNSLGDPIQPDRPYLINDMAGFPGSRQDYIRGYVDQMKFINTLTIKSIDAILQNSTRPVVIVIQGDHGPGAYTDLNFLETTCVLERSSILNAYYFPNQQYNFLSPEISPVNTFRVILNQFFAAQLPLIENRTVFSFWNDPYNFADVTNQTNESCKP